MTQREGKGGRRAEVRLRDHSGRRGGQEAPTPGPTRVPGAPHDTAEPRPRLGPLRGPPITQPHFSPRYRPVVLRPGEEHGEGSGRQRLRGGLEGQHAITGTEQPHTATEPRPCSRLRLRPRPLRPAPPAPASYWLLVVPAEMIGPTSCPARLWLVRGGRDKGRPSVLNRRWLLGARNRWRAV